MSLTTGRKVVAILLTVAGAIGTVVAFISNLQTAESLLPRPLRPYIILVPAVCFIMALLAIRHAGAEPDGVLYRENIKLRQSLDVVQERLRALEPRSLSPEQAARIAQTIELWPAFRHGEEYRRRVLIAASADSPDAGAYAGAIRMALDRGHLYSDAVHELAWTDRRSMEIQRGDITVCGIDSEQHDGEPLEQVLVRAFTSANIIVSARPDFVHFGQVAVVVGSGH